MKTVRNIARSYKTTVSAEKILSEKYQQCGHREEEKEKMRGRNGSDS
jgi:hypothetical protein